MLLMPHAFKQDAFKQDTPIFTKRASLNSVKFN